MRRSDIGPYRLLPDWILFADLSPIALKLWCVLASYANNEDVAWPSMTTLCEKLGTSKNTVLKARDELISLGCLEATKRLKEDGSHTTTIYVIRYARTDSGGSEIEPGVVQKMNEGGSISDTGGGSKIEPELRTNKNENQRTRGNASRFTPPSVSDVAGYMTERGQIQDAWGEAEAFVAHHEQRDWMIPVGRTTQKMKSWRLAVVTWERVYMTRRPSVALKVVPGGSKTGTRQMTADELMEANL